MKVELNDMRLVEKIKLGDQKIIKSIYSDYMESCMITLRRLGIHKSDLEDQYQEAFTDFIVNIRQSKFRGESNLKTYLNKIAKYKYLNKQKKKQIQTTDIESVDYKILHVDENPQADKRILSVLKGLELLDEKCKHLLKCFYFEGRGLKDLSEELELTYQFIRQKKKRCIDKMKKNLKM